MRIFLLYLITLAILTSVCALRFQAKPEIEFCEESYIVQSGDTLWRISTLYCPDSMDLQMYVQMLRERNNLDGAIIYPGQRLTVFVERAD
jgi:hypothetical protein